MPSTHKKVIVRRFDPWGDAIPGYVGAAFLASGNLELMNTSGKVVTISLAEIKGVYFVRDFNEAEAVARKTFTTRPRTEGLWVRLRFQDNEVLEGMMPNELLSLPSEGIFVNPPDTRSNTQRIFVPRSALQELSVLSVIGGPMQRRRRASAGAEEQFPMFGE